MSSRTVFARSVADKVGELVPTLATRLRPDVRYALERACDAETGRGRIVLEQLLENARIAETDHVPLCQDTGTVWLLLEVGAGVSVPSDVFSGVDEAVAHAYASSALRMSVLRDALYDRTNTMDNTPAFCDVTFSDDPALVGKARLSIMLKGGGSDNASRVVMLPPGAGVKGITDAVLECVAQKAANACPPLLIGIGIGTTFDHVGGLAKRALLRSVDASSDDRQVAAFEQDLLQAVNATGIGPAALGGRTTALCVHIETAPCHIAALPLAINMGCSAMRSATVVLEGGLA